MTEPRIPLAGVIGSPISQSRSPRLHRHWLTRNGLRGFYIPMDVNHGDLAEVIRALPKAYQTELLDRRRQLDRYSRMLIEKAVAEGALRDVDVRLTSNFFMGAVNWILRWHTEDDETPPEAVSEHFLDLFMNGITARA